MPEAGVRPQRTGAWGAAALVVAAAVVTPWSIPLEHGIAAAAWLAPVLLLLIVRGARASIGVPVAGAVLIASAAIAAEGFLAGGQRLGFAILFGLLQLLPYAADRLLCTRLSSALRTLPFPLALTAIDALLARFSPMASWGSPAYAHVDELVFVQLAALTGMAGLTFAAAWTAAVAVEIIGRLRAGMVLPRVAYVWLAAAVGVVAFGSLRLATAPPAKQWIRVAGVTQNGGGVRLPPPQARIAGMSDTERAALKPAFDAGVARLMDRTRREAAAGAQIVVWNEQAARILVEDKAALLAGAAALARETHVYLLAAYVVFLRSDHMPFSENRAALYSPQGKLVFDYPKAHPIPGHPYDAALPGGAPVPVVDTPLGRLASVICYDADFPVFTAQAGRRGADMLLVPAFDWDGIRTVHSRMARLRAVEEGTALFRITSHAQSVASDAYGRILASADDADGANDGTMVAMLPVQRAFVTAPWVVGAVAPLALAALAGLFLYGWIAPHRAP